MEKLAVIATTCYFSVMQTIGPETKAKVLFSNQARYRRCLPYRGHSPFEDRSAKFLPRLPRLCGEDRLRSGLDGMTRLPKGICMASAVNLCLFSKGSAPVALANGYRTPLHVRIE